jgi:AcrR family transcriptional regulator
MPQSLQSHKQQLVHGTIYEAAIVLFDQKGFEQTTVEEVAEAAGVSRRSFFRYYASKDDLLAQGVLAFGAAQVAAIRSCPPEMLPILVVRETVAGALKLAAEHPRTRQVIAISERSAAAKQAQMSRICEIETQIAQAFAERIPNAQGTDALPRLLAGLTTLIMGVSLKAWYRGEFDDMQRAADAAFCDLSRLFACCQSGQE